MGRYISAVQISVVCEDITWRGPDLTQSSVSYRDSSGMTSAFRKPICISTTSLRISNVIIVSMTFLTLT